MTLRERIADWISGGALTQASDDLLWLKDGGELLVAELLKLHAKKTALEAVLRGIAAEERPGSNATVRRMARMATEALK